MKVFPEACLLVFAKAPIAGGVKTRLIPALGETKATRFHERLVRHILSVATRAQLAPVSLWCSPNPDHFFFQDCCRTYGVTLHTQEGNDLGERMAHAFEETLKEGLNKSAFLPLPPGDPHPSSPFARGRRGGGEGVNSQKEREPNQSLLKKGTMAVLIGTDCPCLSANDLKMAFDALGRDYDAVFGPAEDGGYVLIGLRRPVPELFVNMPWGSSQVMAETRARLHALGLRFHELSERWDVDRPEDLIRLKK